MGLTFRKRDDFDELMDGLGVSNVDLINIENELELDSGKKKDPFAKFLEPQKTDKIDADVTQNQKDAFDTSVKSENENKI